MNDTPASRYQSSLETYSVKVAGRWTSVRIEPDVMAALKDVALAEGRSLAELSTRIADARPHGSLASALRLYVVRHFRERAKDRARADLAAGLATDDIGVRATLFARDDNDYVLRHTFDLDSVDQVDPCIGFLFVYWKALCKGADRPRFEDFKLEATAAVGFDHNVHLLGVEAANPEDFRIIRQAPVTMICRIGNNMPLKELGSTLYPREVRADYDAVKNGRQPVLQKVAVRVPEGALRYQRIMLPCADRDGEVDRLIVGVVAAGPLVRGNASAPAFS
ncbi:MAG TPA: ribbon-helix-helix domain-containing protein [Candidatus Sulfotelmatobacter sp.]|nr:ribbon-helix-helix domain-containing protein [Candidatus Sulfotelmatobacter sp.]